MNASKHMASAPATGPAPAPQPPKTPKRASAPHGIFTRFAVRSLRQNRTRTVVSLIGIALSCALITAIFTSVATLYSGLLTAELERDGSWQVALINLDDAGMERLEGDERVKERYTLATAGAALMPESFEGYWGRYLTVHNWPSAGAVKDLRPLPVIAEGREPQGPGEIVLGHDLKGVTMETGANLHSALPNTGLDENVERVSWEDNLEVGSQITLSLGQRTYRDPETGLDAPCFADEGLYIDMDEEGDVITEYLADAAPAQTFTVVGFFDEEPGRSGQTWMQSAGYLGFVAPGTLPARQTDVYLNTNLTTRADIDGLIEDYTGLEHALFNGGGNRGGGESMAQQTIAYSHDSLLRYQGMVDDRAIWGTLYTLAAILSGVVIVASVSLIYNSFAIAVSERTRQFGLLASLGASKAQLRRTVFAEALALAAVGIPFGLLIGLAGTVVVFNIAGEGIGMLIDGEAFAGTRLTSVVVSPAVLAVCAALALVTVLISAAVPAWRASRVSAVDAIRQSRDVRLSRRERRAARRAERAAHKGGGTGAHRAAAGSSRAPITRTLDNLRLRLIGVPGLMAHRNLTRASSKGRVAVASLAVSVALIIISGAIAHYLGYLALVADSDGSDIEVSLSRTLADDETTADGIAAIDAAYRALGDVDGARPEGYSLYTSLFASFEPGVLDTDTLMEQGDEYEMPDRGAQADGTAYAPTALIFVDGATWEQLLEENDLDAERFSDPAHPLALGLNNTQSNDGRRYSYRDLFSATGSARLFTHIEVEGEDDLLTAVDVDEDGAPIARFETDSTSSAAEFDENGQLINHAFTRPLDDVLKDEYELAIGAIVDSRPAAIASYASIWPTLVLPVDALPTIAASSETLQAEYGNGSLARPFAYHNAEGAGYNWLGAYLSFGAAKDARAVERAMNRVIENEVNDPEWYRVFLMNNAENVRQAQLMYETIQLFIGCFIAITTAIAVANVFNTLTNSIMLRRREFAMLKSAGMGNRAFLKMIALECLSYAWRGLAIGLGLGAVVTWLVWQAMSLSFAGIDFTVPLGWVLAAFGLVAGVLALSTVYALRKSRASSIVETLREDAI